MSHPRHHCTSNLQHERLLEVGDEAAVAPASATTRAAVGTVLRAEPAEIRRPPVPDHTDEAVPVALQESNGRYRGRRAVFELKLWVDIDATRRKNCISGDFYRVDGALKDHCCWFFVRTSVVHVTPAQVVVKGLARFPFVAGAPLVQVTMTPCSAGPQGRTAVVEFLTGALIRGMCYVCAFESEHYSTTALDSFVAANRDGHRANFTRPDHLSTGLRARLPQSGY